MALFEEQITDTLETGAPSIRYTGKEGPRPSMQSQEEMMIAKQIWEAMGDEERGQFSNFEEFFASGIWKQILQQAQQDEAQGQQGPETQQGIGSLGPRNMEQQMPMPNRMGAEYGGRIGFEQGLGASLHGDEKQSGIIREVQFLMHVLGISKDEAIRRVTSQSEGSFPRPEISPPQAPLRPRGLPGMRPPEEEIEEVGIESLRGNI